MSILTDAINRLLGNEGKFNQLVNGDALTTVQTDNGVLPSIAKILHDKAAEIDQFIPAMETKQDLDEKDQPNGYVGMGAGFAIRVKNGAGNVSGWLTAAFSKERTIILPDDDGTVALTKQLIAAETKQSILQKLGADQVTGTNTGDQSLESLGAQPKLGYTPLDVRMVGIDGGVVPLGDDGLIDPKYMPDTTQSVVRYANSNAFPLIGEDNKIYIDSSTKFQYYWDTTATPPAYQQMETAVPDTDSIPEGDVNLFFTIDRVLQVTLNGFNIVNKVGYINPGDTIIDALGKAQYQLVQLITNMVNYATLADPTFTGSVSVPDADTGSDSAFAVNVKQLRAYVAALSLTINNTLITKEAVANKVTDFTVLDDFKYPTTRAVSKYMDTRLVSVVKGRGNWLASTGTYPTSGGSASDGSIAAGDLWFISGNGLMNGIKVNNGDSVRALVDNPGQIDANWAMLEANIGYVPANVDGTNTSGTWPISTTGTVKLTDATTDNFNYTLVLAAGTSGQQTLKGDTDVTYNPSTNTLTVPKIVTTNLTVNGTSSFNDLMTSTGTTGNSGGILKLIRNTLPQWILRITGAAANQGQYGGWLESDGTLSLGSQDDSGNGTKVMNLARTGGNSQIWSPTFYFRNPTVGVETNVMVDGNAGQMRRVSFATGGLQRWQVHCDDNVESGGNIGSNFGIARYQDNGALVEYVFTISRSTGIATFAHAPKITDTLSTSDNSNSVITSQWIRNIMGIANGLVPLDGTAKISSTYLPSYVDDVLEYATYNLLPAVGETGKIYVVISDSNNGNKTWQYRWTGSVYAAITPSPGTTDSVVEGVTNLYFTVSRVLATALTGFSTASKAVVTAADTVVSAIGKLQAQITAIPYDIAGGMGGKPGASDTAVLHVAIRPFTIAAGTASAVAAAGTAAAAAYTFTLYKNATQIGTIAFGAGSAVGTVTITASTAFVAGDVLKVTGAATPDASLSDLSATFSTTLN